MICMLGSATCKLTRMKPHQESATLEQSSARGLLESQRLCVCRSGFLKASRACTLRCAVRTAFHPTCSDQTARLWCKHVGSADPKVNVQNFVSVAMQRFKDTDAGPAKPTVMYAAALVHPHPSAFCLLLFRLFCCLGLCERDLDHEIR